MRSHPVVLWGCRVGQRVGLRESSRAVFSSTTRHVPCQGYIHTCAYIHTYIHTYIYTHTHTYIYIYKICRCSRPPSPPQWFSPRGAVWLWVSAWGGCPLLPLFRGVGLGLPLVGHPCVFGSGSDGDLVCLELGEPRTGIILHMYKNEINK